MKKERSNAYETELPDDIKAINYFDYFFVKDNFTHMEGRMLTIVESVLSDKEQRKAVKDLVKNEFANKYNWIFEAAHLVDVDTDYEHSIIPIKDNK